MPNDKKYQTFSLRLVRYDDDFLFSNTISNKLASVEIEAAFDGGEKSVFIILNHSLLSKHNIGPELVPVDTTF